MNKCLVCKKEISLEHTQLWLLDGTSVCMGCEFKQITVYHITLPGEKNGYYENDIGIVTEMLIESDYDSGYTIIKEKMNALKFYSLPEFTGF